MPRISQEQAQERRAFLLDLFRSNPDISRQEALQAFEEQFGSTINMKTFQELRDQALKEQGPRAPAQQHEEEEEEEQELPAEEPAPALRAAPSQPEPALNGSSAHGSAFGGLSNGASNGLSNGASAQPKGRPAKGGARQKNVFVDAPKEQLDFLERVLVQLQEAGATNVRIDHATERWMVLTVDVK